MRGGDLISPFPIRDGEDKGRGVVCCKQGVGNAGLDPGPEAVQTNHHPRAAPGILCHQDGDTRQRNKPLSAVVVVVVAAWVSWEKLHGVGFSGNGGRPGLDERAAFVTVDNNRLSLNVHGATPGCSPASLGGADELTS